MFSTIKVIDGVLFAFERHWARMSRDAALMHVPMPASRDGIREKLLELIERNGASDSTLRLVAVRNYGGAWEGPAVRREPDVIAFTTDTKNWGRGVNLTYVAQGRHSGSPFAGTKILSWAMNLTWAEEAQSRGFDEVVLLNERGEVSECTSANIFAAKRSEVWTPPLKSSGCLPGVTRELLVEEVRVPGYKVIEKTLLPTDLESADEVFITSTTRDLLPVLAIDGKRMGTNDAARSSLQSRFNELVKEYVEAAARPARA